MAVPVQPIGSYTPRGGATVYVYRSGVDGALWRSAVAVPGTVFAGRDASGQLDFWYGGGANRSGGMYGAVFSRFSCVPLGATWTGELSSCVPPVPTVTAFQPAPELPAVEFEPPAAGLEPPAVELEPPPARVGWPRFVLSLPALTFHPLDAPGVVLPGGRITPPAAGFTRRTPELPSSSTVPQVEPELVAEEIPDPIPPELEPPAELEEPEPVLEEPEAEPIEPAPELGEPDVVPDPVPEQCNRGRGGHDHAAGSFAPAHGARARGGTGGLDNADRCGGNSGFVGVGGNTFADGLYEGGGSVDVSELLELEEPADASEGADMWWEDFADEAESTYEEAEVAVTGTYETVSQGASDAYDDAADAVTGAYETAAEAVGDAAQSAGELLGGAGQGTAAASGNRGFLLLAAVVLAAVVLG